MENLKLELSEIITHCRDVKTFRFALEKDIHFKPGQYLSLTLPVQGKDATKVFSISNSPTEKGFVQFTKKISESAFSKTLLGLEISEKYALRLPMGKFTFTGEYPKVAFLSGGIGITPIRSIFKYATDTKLASSLVLLYSSRTPDHLIFRNDLDVMQQANKNIKVVYTLTQSNEEIPGCRKGVIDEGMVKAEVPDYTDRIFYICGPPGMVSGMKALLTDRLSVPASKIVTEDFLGY